MSAWNRSLSATNLSTRGRYQNRVVPETVVKMVDFSYKPSSAIPEDAV